ncbi:MAG: hypothetical protein KJ576_08125, partial [Proteobacteria bacterium]|nr:hypothetical protein [Pseudomonadota bacterium]
MYWWDRREGLLQDEIEALRQAGARPILNEEALAAGQADVSISAVIRGNTQKIIIKYPDLFPYFRPEFFCVGLEALGHYNPITGHMCLLTRGTEHWTPGMKAANLYLENLPKWEEAAFSDRATAPPIEGEDLQAEPFSAYYTVAPFMAFMMDSSWEISPTATAGTLKVIFREKISQSIDCERLLGLVLSISDNDNVIHEVPDKIMNWASTFLDENTILDVPWIRLNEPIQSNDPKVFFDKINTVSPNVYQVLSSRHGQYNFILCGFTFREEIARGIS